MPQGGDIVSVFIKRASGESRKFTTATGGDNNRIRGGGYTEEVEGNGDGSVRYLSANRPGERELVLSVDDKLGDHDWLAEVSNDPEPAVVSYTHQSGKIYFHEAKPMGDMAKSDKNATATVTFKGTPIIPQ